MPMEVFEAVRKTVYASDEVDAKLATISLTPGPAGPQGPRGDAGPTGATGARGATGPVGPQGPAGPIGVAGSQGPVGPVGPQGVQGDPGPQGPAGANGSNGKSVRNGPGPPSTSIGYLDDWYIDRAAKVLYGPKAAAGWGTGVSLVGPTGAQGVPGPAVDLTPLLARLDAIEARLTALETA